MIKDLLEGEPKMGGHANTYEKPVNGAEQVTFLPKQNGASCNSVHLEMKEITVGENKPKMPSKKMYTWKDLFLYLFIILFCLSFIGNIVQAVRHDQCPSCVNRCPQGWVLNDSWCYYFSTVEETWNSSQSNCSSYGGSLTAIDTPSEMEFINSNKEATDYWIGLRREEGQPWKWANGSVFDPWFPIGADGPCAYLIDGKVSSAWCEETKRGWICRMPVHQT